MKKIKKVVYGCITGGYDNVPVHKYIAPGWDYVLFTDNADLIKAGKYEHWTIKPLVFDKLTNVKNARWHKVNAHKLFPEYDYSLWLDSNIIVNSDGVFNVCDKLIKDKVLIGVPNHILRDCIYDEAQIIKQYNIDYPRTVNREMKFLKREKYPEHNGLAETNILFRKHNAIIPMSDLWWQMIERFSKRDQLSFNYALWKTGIKQTPIYTESDGLGHHRESPDFTFVVSTSHNQDKIKRKNMKLLRKERCPNGRRHIYFLGIKIFSYFRKQKRLQINDNGKNNSIDVLADNISVNCNVFGNNNTVLIEQSKRGGHINIHIRGNNNKIHIKPSAEIQTLNIAIGNYMEISNSEIFIDEGVCIVNVEILIEQHHCKLHVGKKCLMSKNILFRLGEIPHLVFDSNTKEYVDTPADLIIGDHVWIGAGATILKKSRIGNDCIVGTQAVVTKEFKENNVLLAGNPAQIKRRNVYWTGSYGNFHDGDKEYKKNYEEYIKQFGETSNFS